MTTLNQTILDTLLGEHPLSVQVQPASVAPDDLVHVVGTQEPVRDQPDDRARSLLTIGWLKVESVRPELPEAERARVVSSLQQAARAWLKQEGAGAKPDEREQVRWLTERTRSHESKQQIVQRVWETAVLYGLGHRGLRFDDDGQIHWQGGVAGRIGLGPDAVVDLAWGQSGRQTYAASFREPDGAIMRGKGRHRWNVYRITVDPAADPLFKRRAQRVHEKVALIVASEIYATQPQLPRSFYGGNEFQQACIDAQDQQFAHILVLSPQHGVISLDDVVSGERSWDEVMERRIWAWQLMALQRLGRYLFGSGATAVPHVQDVNWWAWLNPESVYEFTLFGQGFAVRILVDHILRARMHRPGSWPEVIIAEQRPGYDVGDLDDDIDYDYYDDDLDGYDDQADFDSVLDDLDQLFEWAGELVTLINIHVAPTDETWELAPDETLIPVRLLADTGIDMEELLDLLTDITLLLESPLPFTLIIHAQSVVSALLQVAHSITHNEVDMVMDPLRAFPEGVLSRYVENVLQDPDLEERMCAVLSLTEQMHLLAMTIPAATNEQLVVWLQTYLSSRIRQTMLGKDGMPPQPPQRPRRS